MLLLQQIAQAKLWMFEKITYAIMDNQQASLSLTRSFTDYSERKYIQANGNSKTAKAEDIVGAYMKI